MMMKELTLEDKFVLNEIFVTSGKKHNEFDFMTLFSWHPGSQYFWYLNSKDQLVLYSKTFDRVLMPLGENTSVQDLKDEVDSFVQQGYCGKVVLADKEFVESNREELEKYFLVELDRNHFDYIHFSQNLAELNGRSFSKKRNLIAQFKKLYPNWSVRSFQAGDIDACQRLAKVWCEKRSDQEGLQNEFCALRRSLLYHQELDVQGTLLFVENELIAFSLWNILHEDMATVHFEKTNFDYKGASQALNQATAQQIWEKGVPYINREQDLGEEGLRKAKLSYLPDRFIEVYRLAPLEGK